jgi:hypothetical protein
MPHTESLFLFLKKTCSHQNVRTAERNRKKSLEGTGASWGQVAMARKQLKTTPPDPKRGL